LIRLKTYKVLSTLLLYPSTDLKQSVDFVMDVLKKDDVLSSYEIDKVQLFVSYVKTNNLLFLQESYVSIFDRQKHFSLYLFEHIHGDSRERGMAMIDLKELYKKSSFEIAVNDELPDFIPVFLEYLSLNSKEQASALLGEVINIIAVLHFRLKSIDSPYHVIFSLLEFLSNVKSDEKVIRKLIDDSILLKSSKTEVDKIWEEPKIF